jgi:hypothetical protein
MSKIEENFSFKKLMPVVVGLGLLFIVVIGTRKFLEGFISTRPQIGPLSVVPYDPFIDHSARFINFDLTDKPRQSNAPNPTYSWWKYMFNPSTNQQYRECDQYRCANRYFNGYCAKPSPGIASNQVNVSRLNFGYDCDYFRDAVAFCNRHPSYDLCPNNWISNGKPTNQVQTNLVNYVP